MAQVLLHLTLLLEPSHEELQPSVHLLHCICATACNGEEDSMTSTSTAAMATLTEAIPASSMLVSMDGVLDLKPVFVWLCRGLIFIQVEVAPMAWPLPCIDFQKDDVPNLFLAPV